MSIENGATTPAPGQHVPAWKRIGLKLKYAKDVPTVTSNPKEPVHHGSSKRSSELENADASRGSSRPAKKRKKSSDAASENSHPKSQPRTSSNIIESSGENDTSEHPARASTEPTADGQDRVFLMRNAAHEARPKGRRKSVSFTPETKQEDGESAGIYFKQWSAEQQAKAEELTEGPEPAQAATETTKAPKKPKREKIKDKSGSDTPASKSSKKRGKQVSATTPQETPDYVKYVQIFHNDKPAWKFNKNKQTDLLKNLFNIYRVPPEHTPAIKQYLAGLQGAGPREKLLEEAHAILKGIVKRDPENANMSGMETEAARRAAYNAALERHLARWEEAGRPESDASKEQVEEMRQQGERGKRAEAVLGELLQKALYPPAAAAGKVPKDEVALSTAKATRSDTTSKRKKRKARTQAESSSDSSSDSDSDEDKKPAKGRKAVFDEKTLDEAFPKTVKPAVAAKASKAAVEGSSDDSSSDDSSDSDREDESSSDSSSESDD